MTPIVILVRPQMGENIGAVARAMRNFGFSELRLAAPRDGWPNARAMETASGGEAIIEGAKVFPDFKAAMADIHIAYATTARPRDMEKRVVDVATAVGEIEARCRMSDVSKDVPLTSNIRPPASGALRHALVFGPERTGLENEEIVQCDTLITIPTAPQHSSLNLGQAMVVVGYEWWKASAECGVQSVANNKAPHPTLDTPHSSLATKSEWQGLFGQMEAYLDEVNYYRVPQKKPIMWQNLQNMLMRANLTSQEVRTFRGVLRALWERKRRG